MNGLKKRVATLEAEVATLKGQLGALQGQVGTLQGQLAAKTQQLDSSGFYVGYVHAWQVWIDYCLNYDDAVWTDDPNIWPYQTLDCVTPSTLSPSKVDSSLRPNPPHPAFERTS